MALLLKKEKMRILAEKAGIAETRDRATLSEYDTLQVRLRNDEQTLKSIQSNEKKEAYKREHIEHYIPWIEGIIEGNEGREDHIISHMFLWSIDILNIPLAMTIAEYMIAHSLTLPAKIKSPTVGFIAESFSNIVFKNKDIISPEDFETIFSILHGKDMFAPVEAKLNKALGIILSDDDPEKALSYFKRALELDDGSGVKKLITNVEKNLAALQKEPV